MPSDIVSVVVSMLSMLMASAPVPQVIVCPVAPPLAIGTIALEDGETVKGFLCESWDAARARDITEFGGWRAYVASLKPKPTTKKKNA